MAGILVVLRALRRIVWRDVDTILSLAFNNFFLFIIPIAAGSILAIVPFLFLFGILLIFPISADPLEKIPTSRLRAWPLSKQQMIWLRIGSLALSPALWIAVVMFMARAGLVVAIMFLTLAFIVRGLAILFHRTVEASGMRLAYWIPQIPGQLGGLVRLFIRQILSVLDLYASCILSISATAYRVLRIHPDPETFPICAVLVALGLSTYAQQMFGLDSAAALERYRMLPIPGHRLLFAKDVAYLFILGLLVSPLDIGAGLTFGFVSIAIGRYSSLRLQTTQVPWRFVSGDLRVGILQIICGMTFGIANHRVSSWFLGIAFLAYAVSLFAGGWWWDRRKNLYTMILARLSRFLGVREWIDSSVS